MLKHIDTQDFISAFLTLNGTIIVSYYDYADQSDGTTFKFVEQDEYNYSVALVQELDELFNCDVHENTDDINDMYEWY